MEFFPTRSWDMFNGHNKFLVTHPPVAVGILVKLNKLKANVTQSCFNWTEKRAVEIVPVLGRVTSNN